MMSRFEKFLLAALFTVVFGALALWWSYEVLDRALFHREVMAGMVKEYKARW